MSIIILKLFILKIALFTQMRSHGSYGSAPKYTPVHTPC